MKDLYKINKNYYYVYEHWLDGQIIYVGKGKLDRAFSPNRNLEWKERVKENSGVVDVVIKGYFENEEDAFSFEKLLITKHLYENAKLTNITHNFNHKGKFKYSNSIPSKTKFKHKIKKEIKFKHHEQAISLIKDSIKINKENKIIIFVNFKYNAIVKKLNNENGFKPLKMSSFNNGNVDGINLKKIKNELKKGLIPEPYNILIYPTELLDLDKVKIKDSMIKLVIMNTMNEIEINQALSKFEIDIEKLIFLSKDTKINHIDEIILEEKYLNVPLTAKDRNDLCLEKKILNSNGDLIKWGTMKKLLIKNNVYEIKNHTKNMNGKRTRVVTISNKNSFDRND